MRNLNIVIRRISCSVLRPFWLVGSLLIFLSCQKQDQVLLENVIGRWDITRAERNGKETPYLRRGYFIIDQTTMIVNITGADEKGTYKLTNNTLVMGDKNFEVETVKNDTMIVKYLAGPHSEFVFRMLKKKEDVQ